MAGKKPVLPEEDAQQILDAWNATEDPAFMKQAQAMGHSPEDVKGMVKALAEKRMQNYSMPEEKSSLLKNVLSVLDYGAGMIRTPSMEIAAALSGPRGREAVSKNLKQDWSDTLTPFEGRPAPSTQEWLNRMGLKKGEAMTGKVLQVPWNTMFFPKQMLTGKPTPPAPGPDWYDVASFGGDAGLSPGGLGLLGKGVKTMQPIQTAKDIAGVRSLSDAKFVGNDLLSKLGRLVKGKGPVPNQDLYNMTAREAEQALSTPPTFAQKYIKPPIKFAADPLAFTVPRVGEKIYKGVFREADRLSKAAGFGPVSDTLAEQGITGSPGEVYDATQGYQKDLGKSLNNVRKEVQQYVPIFNLERTRKSVRGPMKDFFDLKEPVYGRDASDAAKDMVWDQWNQTMPGKKILDIQDLHNVKKGFQGMAREAGAYGNAPQNTGGMKPSMAFENRRQAELAGDAFSEQAKLARQAEEGLYDEFSNQARAQFGESDPTMMGSVYHLGNRRMGALMNAQPALLQRYRFSPTQQSFGGAPARVFQEYVMNPADWLRTNLGLQMSRYGQLGGMGLRGAAAGKYNEKYRNDNPWKLLDINLSGTGDTSYEH